jgi:hypothetical protein
VALLVIGLAAVCGCRSTGSAAEREKLDAPLRALARTSPDSMVGVLIRTAGRLTAEQRDTLEAAGVTVGSVAGDVTTGRMPARVARAAARLGFVVHIELARAVPIGSTS